MRPVSYFVTHAEVVVDPTVEIEQWGLSALGRRRAEAAHRVAWHPSVARIVSSSERKAVEMADALADSVGHTATRDPLLGEIDRSATGYLPPEEFEPVVGAFFAAPTESVRGWERAVDAQERIVGAVRSYRTDSAGTVFVSHGAVGALLFASLSGRAISRSLEQPGMGSVFAFDPLAWTVTSGWQRIEPASR